MSEKRLAENLFEPTPECPSIEELVSLSESPKSGGQATPIHRHIADCPRCQAELALLTSFQEAEATPEEQADVGWVVDRLPKVAEGQPARVAAEPEPTIWVRLRSWLGQFNLFRPLPVMAAIAALVVLTIGIRELTNTAPELRAPGQTGGLIMRGGQIGLLTPLTGIDSLPAVLEWEPVAGAVRYEVIVRYVDGAEAARFTANSSHTEWPGDVRALATPGRSLFIEVAAIDPAGNQLATSGRQLLKLGNN